MRIPQVNHIDTEPGTTSLQRLFHIVRRTVYTQREAPARRQFGANFVFIVNDAELGPDESVVPAARNRPGNQLFIVAGAVGIGGIDKIHAEIKRVPYRSNRLRFVDAAIKSFKHHRTIAEAPHLGPLVAKHAFFNHPASPY